MEQGIKKKMSPFSRSEYMEFSLEKKKEKRNVE